MGYRDDLGILEGSVFSYFQSAHILMVCFRRQGWDVTRASNLI